MGTPENWGSSEVVCVSVCVCVCRWGGGGGSFLGGSRHKEEFQGSGDGKGEEN